MGNHRSPEVVQQADANDQKSAAHVEGPSPLQLDAGVGAPCDAGTGPAAHSAPLKDHYREAYMINTHGTEDQFMSREPGRIRAHFGLESGATAQALFDRMAEDSYKTYKGSSPDLKAEVKQQYQLGAIKGDIPIDAFKAAHLAYLRKDAGLIDEPSFEKLEAARNKQTYEAAHNPKTKTHIDFD